ncbi:MAG: hypothetical protein A3G76_10445 [Acidobacteria bacterium RIFCSPLOWO2_12_FULL_65_11]|nr:MAG: hypothetical protein A3G76_10445 [Acidobacteria bacterium RIFCSPLOWO2_12_FULL_65_11]
MTTTIARIRTVVLLACLLVGLSASSAGAQSLSDLGGRLGVSGGPSQFYIGGHGAFGPLVDQLWFRPNLEAGFGDNVTVLAFNIEFQYRIKLTGSLSNAPWSPYIIAGPALVYAHTSVGNFSGSSTGGGFNIGFGLQHSRGLFTEIKFGVADSPDFKFGVGYNFR